ncbi:MAG: hypothetical protein Q8M95_08445 [Candidatus Methanoperedens sp.]|nr:hypothetical protein [Candidatus Methanoperedens sp.]
MKINESALTSTQLAIIALLKAKDINKIDSAPIPGNIHLVKEMFAIQNTDIGNQLLDELNFEPDNFGPFDETIFAALDDLRDAGLVENVQSKNNTIIKLTKEGEQLAEKIWDKLREDVKAVITFVKVNFNHISSEKLLDRIYSIYPEMAKYSISKVAKKYQ